MPNKTWENYDNMFALQEGLQIETFQFFKEESFNCDALREALERVATEQEHLVVILNFPNNPTGYTPTLAEVNNIVDSLVEFCSNVGKPVVVLINDAYENFVYAGGTSRTIDLLRFSGSPSVNYSH